MKMKNQSVIYLILSINQMKKSNKKIVTWLMIDVAQQKNSNIKYYTSTFKYYIWIITIHYY